MNYENLSHKARVKAKKAYKEDKEFVRESILNLIQSGEYNKNLWS